MKSIKIEIVGRVQGVRFRQFVKEKADKLGLKGFVSNKKTGEVLIFAQGKKRDLDEFLKFVQKGPILSKVKGISYFWNNEKRDYEDFEIKVDKGFIKDQKSSFVNLGKNLLKVKNKVPRHVAIIPDGNRRWAKSKGLSKIEGYRKSATHKNFVSLLQEAKDSGIKYLTFWLFSTDNWKRDSKELKELFDLITNSMKKFGKELVSKKIRFRHLGRKDRLPKKLVEVLIDLENKTKEFKEFNLQFCLDYGGRDEIVRALNKVLKSGVQELNEDDFASFLDSHEIPDPDLIIRTSGEYRISGFMPFQSAHSEFYFTNLHFPDFGAKQLREAIEEFISRRRRFGGS